MINPMDYESDTAKSLAPPVMLNANKMNADRRGLIQTGMNEAQAMNKAANNQSNQFYAKGGMTMAEEREDFKRKSPSLEKALNNRKSDVVEALKDPTLRSNLEVYDDPTPSRKPRPTKQLDMPTEAPEEPKAKNRLSVSSNMDDEELNKVFDNIAPKRGMNKGGIMKYANGGAPPGALPKEIADDVPAKLSEGEFVFSADATRYWGLKTLMGMVLHARHELLETEQNEEDEQYPVDELGQFIHPPADMEAYEDDEFGPEYNKGGAIPSFFDGGSLDNDIQYARGGLMQKVSKKEPPQRR